MPNCRQKLVLAAVFLLGLCAGGTAAAAARSGETSRAARKVTVLGSWAGADERTLRAVLDEYEQATPGTTATYDSAAADYEATLIRSIAAKTGPDVAILPSAVVLKRLAARRVLKPIAFARPMITRNYAPAWLAAGSARGTLYGVVFEANNKSTVWYDLRSFRGADVKPPATFSELLASARLLRSWGTRAYAIAGADGWTLTDLFENVYLRQAGPKRYDLLATHKLRWTDPSVKAALRTMGRIVGDRTNIPGGASGALETDFAESVSQAFGRPSKAAMVFEGDFVAQVIAASTTAQPGVDFDVFPFPPIGKSGPVVVGGTDASIVVLLRSTPASRSLVTFLASARAASALASHGDFTSPNRRIGAKAYPNGIRQRTALALARAKIFRWDLSELQPPVFGGTASQGEAKLFQDFLRNPKNVNGTAAALEHAAARAYKQ
jgi:ABC-type glycerol-3-phosphate transport system substrate-binding protein